MSTLDKVPGAGLEPEQPRESAVFGGTDGQAGAPVSPGNADASSPPGKGCTHVQRTFRLGSGEANADEPSCEAPAEGDTVGGDKRRTEPNDGVDAPSAKGAGVMSESSAQRRPQSMNDNRPSKIVIHADTHLDHIDGLSPGDKRTFLAWLAERIKDARTSDDVTIHTFHGSPFEISSDLRGPATGGEPVADDSVEHRVRNGRAYASRLLRMTAATMQGVSTRTVTAVVGPHKGEPHVLYTVYGGPKAPREPGDPNIASWEELCESRTFWSKHALWR